MDHSSASQLTSLAAAAGKFPDVPPLEAHQSHDNNVRHSSPSVSNGNGHVPPLALQQKTVDLLESEYQPLENEGETTPVASSYIIPSGRADVHYLVAAATNTFPKLEGEHESQSISAASIDRGQSAFTEAELDENRLRDSGERGFNPAPAAEASGLYNIVSDSTVGAIATTVISGVANLQASESEPHRNRFTPGDLPNKGLVPEHDEDLGTKIEGERSDPSKDDLKEAIQDPDELVSFSDRASDLEADRNPFTPVDRFQNEGVVPEHADTDVSAKIDAELFDPSKDALKGEVQDPDIKLVSAAADVEAEHTEVTEGVPDVETGHESCRDYEQAVVDRREVLETREISQDEAIRKAPLVKIDDNINTEADVDMEAEVVIEPSAPLQGATGEGTVGKAPVAEIIGERSSTIESVPLGGTDRIWADFAEVEKNDVTETLAPRESFEGFDSVGNTDQLVLEVGESKAADRRAAKSERVDESISSEATEITEASAIKSLVDLSNELDLPELEKSEVGDVPVVQSEVTDPPSLESTAEIADGDSICEAAEFTPTKHVALAEESQAGVYAPPTNGHVDDQTTGLQLPETESARGGVYAPATEGHVDDQTTGLQLPEAEKSESSEAAEVTVTENVEESEVGVYAPVAESHAHDRTKGLELPEPEKSEAGDIDRQNDESYEAQATDHPAQEAAEESASHEAAEAMPTEVETELVEKSEVAEYIPSAMESLLDDQTKGVELLEPEKSEAGDTPYVQSLDQQKDRSYDAQATDSVSVKSVDETTNANASIAEVASEAMATKEVQLAEKEDCLSCAVKSHVDDLTKQLEFPVAANVDGQMNPSYDGDQPADPSPAVESVHETENEITTGEAAAEIVISEASKIESHVDDHTKDVELAEKSEESADHGRYDDGGKDPVALESVSENTDQSRSYGVVDVTTYHAATIQSHGGDQAKAVELPEAGKLVDVEDAILPDAGKLAEVADASDLEHETAGSYEADVLELHESVIKEAASAVESELDEQIKVLALPQEVEGFPPGQNEGDLTTELPVELPATPVDGIVESQINQLSGQNEGDQNNDQTNIIVDNQTTHLPVELPATPVKGIVESQIKQLISGYGAEELKAYGEVDALKGDAAFGPILTTEALVPEFEQIATPRSKAQAVARSKSMQPAITRASKAPIHAQEFCAHELILGESDESKAGIAAMSEALAEPKVPAPPAEAIPPPKSSLLGILIDKVTGKHK